MPEKPAAATCLPIERHRPRSSTMRITGNDRLIPLGGLPEDTSYQYLAGFGGPAKESVLRFRYYGGRLGRWALPCPVCFTALVPAPRRPPP